MSNTRRRRPLTQSDIDRSINIQSYQIKKDFEARLSGQEAEMKMMIDHLIRAKTAKSKGLKKITHPLDLKIVAKCEKVKLNNDLTATNSKVPKTADVGVAANSKDIDNCFYLRVNDNIVGDQVKEAIKTSIKSKKGKMIKLIEKENIPSYNNNQLYENKNKASKGAAGPKWRVIPKQAISPRRQLSPRRQINPKHQINTKKQTNMSSKSQLIPDPKQQVMSYSKRVNVQQANLKKYVNKNL